MPNVSSMHYAELQSILPDMFIHRDNNGDDSDGDIAGDGDSDSDGDSDGDWSPPADAPTIRIACNVFRPPEGCGRVAAVVLHRSSPDFRVFCLSNLGGADKATLLSALRAVPAHIKWVEYTSDTPLPMDDPEITSVLEGAHFKCRFREWH